MTIALHNKICQSNLTFEYIDGGSLTNTNILISNSTHKANGKPDKICQFNLILSI